MASGIEGTCELVLFGVLLMVSFTVQTDTATVQLLRGSEYVYGYRSFTHMKDIALVKVAAEVSFYTRLNKIVT